MVSAADLRLYDLRCREIKDYNFDSVYEYYKALNDFSYFKDILTEDSFKGVLRLKRSRKGKRTRTRKKLSITLSSEALKTSKLVFTTCTFDNAHLYKRDGTQKRIETLNKNVDKWIKRHFQYAIVNVDYGEEKERLHYHLIGYLKPGEELLPVIVGNKQSKSKKGFLNWELKSKDYILGFEPTVNAVDDVLDDYKKLTNYLLKINNHANKPSALNHRIRVIGDKEVIESVKKEYRHRYLLGLSYKVKD